MTIENDGFSLCVFLGTTNESHCMCSVWFGLSMCCIISLLPMFLLLLLIFYFAVQLFKWLSIHFNNIQFAFDFIYCIFLSPSMRHWFLNCSRFSHTFARSRIAHMRIQKKQKKKKIKSCGLVVLLLLGVYFYRFLYTMSYGIYTLFS